MLLYEHEGFIEVEAQEIQRLCRSTFAVSFGSEDHHRYELQATLCDYQVENQRRCRIAFHAKSLKRSLVFTLAGSEPSSLWQNGQEILLELGYQLEDVNLKLSPAMLEVVLRDVPGVATPGEARLHRSEYKRLLAELQATCDEDPESPQGKRAALKLSKEKRLQERSAALREILEALFSPEDNADDRTAPLLTQINDLTARLEAAETAAESERSQKVFSEAITRAAEKRIQELEEILVDVETQSSDALKQKRKVVALNGRIKELDAELASVRDALTEEQEKQEQFVEDVKSANEQIVDLQRALKDSETLREEAFAQLGEQESEAMQLDKDYREAKLRIKDLERELRTAEQNADGFQQAVKLSDELQAQRDKLEEELRAETALQESLRLELSAALEERDRLQESLEEAEGLGAAERAELDKEKEILKDWSLRFDQAQSAREALEGELEEAHKIIDSLEKMVRETEDGSRQKASRGASKEQDDRVQEMETRLRTLEDQLQGEVLVKKTLAKELAAAEKKMAEQAVSLAEQTPVSRQQKVFETAVAVEGDKTSKPGRPLPHELRPEPKRGAFFRPDWDLQGLPCSSQAEVVKAWETVFNVQMAIEGYPSQYCMAFMAVLKQGREKGLYLLYRLKKDKHTLVCVPTQKPKDEASLQKAVKQGLDFLRKSGFEMDEMSKDHIESTLGNYFLESD